MIKQVRVDHRLLHGQVAFSWTKFLGADCILIAGDRVVKDELRSAALRLSKPSGIKLVIKSIEDSIAAINSGATDKYNLFIVIESVLDAKRLCDGVETIKSINLGGVKSEADKKQISKAVFLSEEEMQMIRDLDDRGIEVEVRMVSDDTSVKAMDLIKKVTDNT